MPFQSPRFSPATEQERGLILVRWIRRNSEGSFWAHVTSRIEGRLNLATCLVNPWTAVQMGYDNNRNNRRLVPIGDRNELIPTDSIGPDRWQFFIKASYLIRF